MKQQGILKMGINLLKAAGVPNKCFEQVRFEAISFLRIGGGDDLCIGLGKKHLKVYSKTHELYIGEMELWVHYFKWLIRKNGKLLGERFGYYDEENLNKEFIGQKIIGFSKKKFLVEITFTNGLVLEIGGGRKSLKKKDIDWFVVNFNEKNFFHYNLEKEFYSTVEMV